MAFFLQWDRRLSSRGGTVIIGERSLLRYANMAAIVLALALAWPTPADAQVRRGRRGRPIVVTAGIYRPFYGPFFHHPYFWGYPGWHPFWGYPAPYHFGPALAAARLQVTPKDTEVYLDGHLVGIVDDFDGRLQRLRVPPGQYILELHRDGMRPWSQPVLLTSGSTLDITHRMEPLAAGEAPAPRPAPAPEPPAPEAPPQPELPPQPATRATPPVTAREPGGPIRAVPGGGAISLRVQPDDAEVLIDGESWSGAAAPGTRLVVHVGGGRHHVVVRKDGYAPYEAEVEVAPGQTHALNVSLTPRR